MRRLIALLAAVTVVAAPLATAGVAVAEGHHDGRGDGGGGHWAPSRQVPQAYRGGEGRGGEFRGGEFRGGGEGRDGGRFERFDPRNDPRGGYRGEPRGEFRGEPRADPRYDPRAYGPPPSAYGAPPRRGGYLGRSGGEVIQDYGRFRLRPPPRGYEWVRTPGGMALVSTMTGQVFDVVPY